MNEESRRASARRPLFCVAWIENRGGLRKCALSDIAEGGAKIRLDTLELVRSGFVLRLAPDGSVLRECRVVWRKSQDVGIAFNTPLSEQTVLLAADETNWTIE